MNEQQKLELRIREHARHAETFGHDGRAIADRAWPDIADEIAGMTHELDQLRQRLAEVDAKLAECFRLGGADNDGNGESWQAQRAVESVRNLRKDYDDACEEMYGEGGLNKRAEQAEAKLELAEQDARRLDWLEAHPNELRFEPFSRSGRAWACCPSTKIGNDGRPHSDVDRFATARAAIDAAIASQGEGHAR